jgi:hypothetical protein
MATMAFYRFLADSIAVVHFAYVAFVVVGTVAILAGAARGWRWVRNFWFRAVHFLMIAVVVIESLCGVLCPLTDWEDRLRELAGEPNEPGSFIGRWIHSVLFVDASPSVLALCYGVVGLAVLIMLIVAPPHWPGKARVQGAGGRGPDSATDDGAGPRVGPRPPTPGP